METVKTINSIKNFFEAPLSSIGAWLAEKLIGAVITITNVSYWWLLAVAMAALFFYVAGQKKFRKYVGLSPLVYIFLQIIKVALT